MKLLFVILAHDRPEQAAELARTLTEAASDGRALIHFDRRADPALFARLEAAVADAPRVELVADRVATPWGEWGLVAAPLNALAQAAASAEAWGGAPDRAILLSGACLPCRPVAQLERWLGHRLQQEFIEVEDQSWIKGGLRRERHQFFFPFNYQTQPVRHRLGTRVQRLLGVARRFPAGLTPRFGSQWWALTWETCEKILAWGRDNPRGLRFFESVWIPDEMAIQTLVHRLVPRRRIFGRGLTHFEFTDKGKPVVFHDDHADYAAGLDAFFFRKAAPGAQALRRRFLDLARADKPGPVVVRDGTLSRDYEIKVRAQSSRPRPGQIFNASQQAPAMDAVLARSSRPYMAVVGPPALTGRILAQLPADAFDALGEVFAPGRVDLGPGREAFGGLRPEDVSIRDQHPALFLTRLIARAERLPALGWSPFHAPQLMEAVLRDPRAIVVVCLPRTGVRGENGLRLVEACAAPGSPAALRPPAPLPGIDPEDALRVFARQMVETGAAGRLLKTLQSLAFAASGSQVAATRIAMSWSAPDPDCMLEERRRAFLASLQDLHDRGVPGAERIEPALCAAWDAVIAPPARAPRPQAAEGAR